MQIGNSKRFSTVRAIFVLSFAFSVPSFSVRAAELRGTVSDPLGAVVPGAAVTLLRDNAPVSDALTNAQGEFIFASLNAGRYKVRATAPGFTEEETSSEYLSARDSQRIAVALKIGNVAQQVVVSATGTPLLDSQVGASISTVSEEPVERKLDVLEAARFIPGAQILQTGTRGGTTDLFVRGGNADANKVLLDGIPINDIGGRVEFGNVASTGIDQIEVLRGPNSVLKR